MKFYNSQKQDKGKAMSDSAVFRPSKAGTSVDRLRQKQHPKCTGGRAAAEGSPYERYEIKALFRKI